MISIRFELRVGPALVVTYKSDLIRPSISAAFEEFLESAFHISSVKGGANTDRASVLLTGFLLPTDEFGNLGN